MEITNDIRNNANIIWDYLVLNQDLVKSDCILVFGGHDPSVAIHASKLFKEKWANTIIISGGVTHPAHFYGLDEERIEAEALKSVLLSEGILEENIILEPKAKNTSENFWFTQDLITEMKLLFKTFILVQKPYTERRTYLTGLNRWSDKSIIISSIKTTFDEYMNCGIEKDKIINMIVGELYRIDNYPNLGYFDKQDIPKDVWNAYLFLLNSGFSRIVK